MSRLSETTVAIIGRACSFRADHGGTKRILRRTARTKCRAFLGFLEPLKHETTDAFARFFDSPAASAETKIGIELGIPFGKSQAAPGYFPDASPPAVDDSRSGD